MAYQRDEHGCYVEPSQRVRQAAAQALAICCPNTGPVAVETIEAPKPVEEGTNGELIPPVDEEGSEGEGSSTEGDDGETAANLPPVVNSRLLLALPSEPAALPYPQAAPEDTSSSMPPIPELPVTQSAAPVAAPVVAPVVAPLVDAAAAVRGVIVATQPERQLAHVHFVDRGHKVPVGTRLFVSRQTEGGRQLIGQVEVEQSFDGASHVRAIGTTMIHQLQSGDMVELPGSHLARR
jgi:hypothetical protein